MNRAIPRQSEPTDALARYLRQSRLTRRGDAVVPALAQAYENNHRTIRESLGHDDLESPALRVVYTLNGEAETVRIGGRDVIVYDQFLGQTFNRLNEFALAEWPADLVLKWSFKHLAFALASLSSADAALAAAHLADTWPAPERPVERSAEVRPVKALTTAVQEYFVLAHEWAHIKVERRRDPERDAFFDELIDQALAIREAQATDASVLQARMAEDELRAVGASSVAEGLKDPDFVKQIEDTPLPGSHSPANEIAAREHLREEIVCDLLATELVMARFADTTVDMATILTMALHGFHNLTSLELIRQTARDIAGTGIASQALAVTTRKGVWRILVPELLGDMAGGSDSLRKKFVEITELHARTVGDQLVFIFQLEFEREFKRATDAGFGGIGRDQLAGALGLSLG